MPTWPDFVSGNRSLFPARVRRQNSRPWGSKIRWVRGVEIRASSLKHGSTRARSGSTGMSCEDIAPIAARGGCGGASDVAIVCTLAGVLIVSVRS